MEFLVSVCIAAVAAALYRIIVPERKFSGQISLLIVCVFLLTGISALSGAEFDIGADAYDLGVSEEYIGFSGEVSASLRERICSDMAEKLSALLGQSGIYPEEIHVIVNISGLYSIDITQVKLVFGAGQQAAAEAAAELLARELTEEIAVAVTVRE